MQRRKTGGTVGFGAVPRVATAVALGVAAALALSGVVVSWQTRVIVGWNVGTIAYLALAWTLMARADAAATRAHALAQDQSSYVIFLIVIAAACASTVAIGFVAGAMRDLDFRSRAWHLALTVIALMSSWLLIQTVFAFHYARRYYDRAAAGGDAAAALLFPGKGEPDYLDFAYYSFVIGMTSQVSDVAVTARHMRHLTLVHCFLAFAFNIAVLALSINIIATVV